VFARLRAGLILLSCAISLAAQGISALPRFEDYPAGQAFEGRPNPPKLKNRYEQLYRTRIREGVEKGWGVHARGWGVYGQGKGKERPGPNFAGRYIVITWGCGSPCIQMAIVDAQTGSIYRPPITADPQGFVLPLLTLGNRVSRPAEVDFRLDSRLMIIRATPVQSKAHPSYEYFFVFEGDGWKLLRRSRLADNTRLMGEP
jgi:hypothetical protein